MPPWSRAGCQSLSEDPVTAEGKAWLGESESKQCCDPSRVRRDLMVWRRWVSRGGGPEPEQQRRASTPGRE